MKKKILSWLLILSLMMGMTSTTFADAASVKGYTMANPMGLNSELKITNLKTANGSWKTASIKVSEVQIDNVGYKKINSTQEVEYSELALRKTDAVKVKVTYTFSGFTGNKNSLIKDNLLAENIYAANSRGIYKKSCQFYSGFSNALYNKVEKYTLGGKTYKGEWYGKKIKDVNFSKPVTMTGYVYLAMDKGTTEGAFVKFALSDNNNNAEAYFVFSNKAFESRIKKEGNFVYGDEQLGFIKADYEMIDITETSASLKNKGIINKSYRVGSDRDPILLLDMICTEKGFYTETQVKEMIKNIADSLSDRYALNINEEGGNYKLQGISESCSKYANIHLINKGSYYVIVVILSDIKEKTEADKLWESYLSNNDLSKVVDSSSAASQPKETSKKVLSKYTYGAEGFGTFASLEELQSIPDTSGEILRYKSKSEESYFILQFFDYSKPTMSNIDTNIKEDLPNATVATLDQGNITVYADNGYSDGSVTNMVIIRGNKIYTFIIVLPKNVEAQKETVIKSYLMSLGYSESQAEALSTAAIFD